MGYQPVERSARIEAIRKARKKRKSIGKRIKEIFVPDSMNEMLLTLSGIRIRKREIKASITQIERALELLNEEYSYLEEEEQYIEDFPGFRTEWR